MSGFRVISDPVAQLTGRMSFLNDRHNLVAQNLAHMETPNYIAKDISFDGFVKSSFGDGDVAYDPRVNVLELTDEMKANGNNVQMEKEMAKMADNSMEYMTAINVLKKNLSMIRYAIGS